MQSACPKQYLQLGQQSILAWTVQAFLQHPAIAQVVVVVSAADAYVDEALKPDARLQVLRCGGETVPIRCATAWKRSAHRCAVMTGCWCTMLRAPD
jgi:2-C-methyl-D-erythritol 4-phosphate cytidylyltransferase